MSNTNFPLCVFTFLPKSSICFFSSFDSEQTYSFRHRLSLVEDYKKFKDMVLLTPPGINRDEQEGGLDALAQVLVCKDIIGWRNESRKIVIFLTDGPYHAAGDGKSAGLFQPYDGKCYTKNNVYTKEREMDYPSVHMINKLAAERDIIIIFLVDYKVEGVYHDLSDVVSGSKLAKYSRNKLTNSAVLVNILKDIYEVSETNNLTKSTCQSNYYLAAIQLLSSLRSLQEWKWNGKSMQWIQTMNALILLTTPI